MIGAQITRGYLDNQCANIAVSLRQDILRVDNLLTGIGTWDAAAFQGIGYSADEAASLLTALAAFKKIRDIGYGLDTQPVAIDLRPYLAVLTGID